MADIKLRLDKRVSSKDDSNEFEEEDENYTKQSIQSMIRGTFLMADKQSIQ